MSKGRKINICRSCTIFGNEKGFVLLMPKNSINVKIYSKSLKNLMTDGVHR